MKMPIFCWPTYRKITHGIFNIVKQPIQSFHVPLFLSCKVFCWKVLWWGNYSEIQNSAFSNAIILYLSLLAIFENLIVKKEKKE